MAASDLTYRIEDEPSPGALAHLAVKPVWPLFGLMFGGSWLAFPWFLFNAFAVGSPTRWREGAAALGALTGNAVIALGLLAATGAGWLDKGSLPYAGLALVVWKLGLGYLILNWQSRSIALYEVFGGRLKNGLPVALLGGLVGGRLLAPLFEHPLIKLVLS